MPEADDLFRPTAIPAPEPSTEPQRPARESDSGPSEERRTQPSGRVRHDEKMTVYVTSEELLELEHARLLLRSVHGLGVDRGRIVRAAVAAAIADLDAHGADSELVRRLTDS